MDCIWMKMSYFLCLSVTYEREGLSYLCHAFQKSGLGDEPGWRNTPFLVSMKNKYSRN